MKKIFLSIVFLIFFAFSANSTFAETAPVASLEEGIVNIISDGEGGYQINQSIELTADEEIGGKIVEHTLTKLHNIEIENLQFQYNGENLEFTIEESSALSRYYLEIPSDVPSSFRYEVTYMTNVEKGVYVTPLFVPNHPARGQENVVTIHFETTPENIIQRNSFPILKKTEDNEVTSYLMNVPSHVNYIYGEERNLFNSFTFASWASIIILLLIVAIWIRSEVKGAKLKEVTK